MRVFFLDTNIFLQCRDLPELPWSDVAGSEDLLLLISRPVQEEIDRLKSDRSGRRAKRARKTNSFIREIILAEDSKLVIRESKPRVEITFPPSLIPQSNFDQTLDLSRADDQIIAQALTYKAAYPDADVAILTHDTNPILTAKRCSLPCVIIPNNWLLTPEPDERDKRIEQLERRVKELERTFPYIEVNAQDEKGNSIDSLTVSIQLYRALTESELKELMTEVQTRYPMVTKFDESEMKPTSPLITGLEAAYHMFQGISYRYEPPTDQQIREYKEVKYPQWLDSVRKFFISLPSCLEFPSLYAELFISITNKGNVPAENIVVEFTALGGILFDHFFHDDNERGEQQSSEFPLPPPPPKGRWIQEKTSLLSLLDTVQQMKEYANPTHNLLRNFHPLLPPKPRDRNTFYWKYGRPSKLEDSWTFECEEFRHQVNPETFEIMIFVSPKASIESGALKCRVTARNLPKPVEYILPINITYVQCDIIKEVRNLLHKSEA